MAILRAHADTHATLGIEGESTRVSNQRFFGPECYFKTIRDLRHRVEVCVWVLEWIGRLGEKRGGE
jgi:hypothetical protein